MSVYLGDKNAHENHSKVINNKTKLEKMITTPDSNKNLKFDLHLYCFTSGQSMLDHL